MFCGPHLIVSFVCCAFQLICDVSFAGLSWSCPAFTKNLWSYRNPIQFVYLLTCAFLVFLPHKSPCAGYLVTMRTEQNTDLNVPFQRYDSQWENFDSSTSTIFCLSRLIVSFFGLDMEVIPIIWKILPCSFHILSRTTVWLLFTCVLLLACRSQYEGVMPSVGSLVLIGSQWCARRIRLNRVHGHNMTESSL